MGTTLTERQSEILEASLQVIESEGLKGFTMRNIAQRIGFTDAALYRHFPDKGAIIGAIARLFRSNTLENLEAIRSNTSLNAVEKLEMFLMGRAREFETKRALTSILFSEELFRGEGEALNLNLSTLETHASQLHAIVSEGQAEGTLRKDLSPSHLVLLLTGPMKQMVSNWKSHADRNPEDCSSLVQTVAEFWKTYRIVTRP
ncbi:MAG: TetR/AcrR family transcriptional regulator [Spirochaetales bacterium]